MTRWSRKASRIKYSGHFTVAPYCSAARCGDLPVPRPARCPPYQYGVFLAEVEVDVATGKTQVLKMTLNADVGVIASRQAVDGQMYGGMVQGIGLALSEDFEDIQKHTNLIACGIPYIKDAPDALIVDFTETPRADRPVRRRRVRRASSDLASRRHRQRHLPRLRRAYHRTSRSSGEGACRPQGPRVANISFLCSLLRSPRRRREHSSILIGTSSE